MTRPTKNNTNTFALTEEQQRQLDMLSKLTDAQKLHLEQLAMYDREEVPEDAPSSMPYGSEEIVAATKGFQPRSRLNNSRGKQFASKAERNEYFMRTATAQHLGKTYIPKELLSTGDFFMWAVKTIRDQPQDANLRRLEQKGFEAVTSDDCPELAMWDYNGEVRDSANYIESGGLLLMVLDKDLHAFEERFHDQARQRQQDMRNSLNVPEPKALRNPVQGARMHY